jgi:hypothetical protein
MIVVFCIYLAQKIDQASGVAGDGLNPFSLFFYALKIFDVVLK